MPLLPIESTLPVSEDWMRENAPGIEIVAKQNADWDRLRAKESSRDLDSPVPGPEGHLRNNDIMALGVQEAVNTSSKDILVVSDDGNDEAYDSIRAGNWMQPLTPSHTTRHKLLWKRPLASWPDRTSTGDLDLKLIDSTNVDVPAEKSLVGLR